MKKKLYLNQLITDRLKTNNSFILTQINQLDTQQYLNLKKELLKYNLSILNIKNKCLIKAVNLTNYKNLFHKTLLGPTQLIFLHKQQPLENISEILNLLKKYHIICIVYNNNIYYNSDFAQIIKLEQNNAVIYKATYTHLQNIVLKPIKILPKNRDYVLQNLKTQHIYLTNNLLYIKSKY